MQAIRREHPLSPLFAHQWEEVQPRGAGGLGFFVRDRVEALDGPRDDGGVAEAGRRRRDGPVGLGQSDHPGARRVGRDRPMDALELLTVAIRRRSADDVVRADEHSDERRPESAEMRELLRDEVIRRIAVHCRIRENDVATTVAPCAHQSCREGSIGSRSGADRERVTEREESFRNGQLF